MASIAISGSMAPRICNLCLRKFTDDGNKVSIMLTGVCIDCYADMQRWEDEGGQ